MRAGCRLGSGPGGIRLVFPNCGRRFLTNLRNRDFPLYPTWSWVYKTSRKFITYRWKIYPKSLSACMFVVCLLYACCMHSAYISGKIEWYKSLDSIFCFFLMFLLVFFMFFSLGVVVSRRGSTRSSSSLTTSGDSLPINRRWLTSRGGWTTSSTSVTSWGTPGRRTSRPTEWRWGYCRVGNRLCNRFL